MAAKEKRIRERIPVGEEVEVAFDDFQSFKVEYAENISIGGMFLKSSQLIPANTTLRFRLKIQDIGREISGSAIVVWTKESTDDSGNKIAGMGLKFIDLDGESESFIRNFVEKHVHSTLEENA